MAEKKPVRLVKDIRPKMETKISMSLERLILNRSALSCCLSSEILIFFATFVVAFGLTSHNTANPGNSLPDQAVPKSQKAKMNVCIYITRNKS